LARFQEITVTLDEVFQCVEQAYTKRVRKVLYTIEVVAAIIAVDKSPSPL
jgi:hypothetical protein